MSNSLSISYDLINFWEESIKNKMTASRYLEKLDMVGGGGVGPF